MTIVIINGRFVTKCKTCLFIFKNPQLSEYFKSKLLFHMNIDMCLTDVLGLIGKVDFTVRHLSSSTSSFPSTWGEFNSGQQCIGNTHQVCCFSLLPKIHIVLLVEVFFCLFSFWFSPFVQKQCSAYSASPASEKTWTMRTTFPEYVVALATIVGSVLFAVS